MGKKSDLLSYENKISKKKTFIYKSGVYLEKEKKYLETLYFQILRNSKVDNFDENCLINFFSFSEKMNSIIFQVISNENKGDLKLVEFTNKISFLFSKYLPKNPRLLIEIVFNIISCNTEIITYDSIKQFLNNLLFECLCKAQIYKYDFYMNFCKSLKDSIRNTFSINKLNSNQRKFIKKDFVEIIEKNPIFLKLIIFLLNILSPINEKLILKFVYYDDIEIFNNDDFEEETEIEDEKTPRINTLPKENYFISDFSMIKFESKFSKPISSLKFSNNENYQNSNNFKYDEKNLIHKNQIITNSFELSNSQFHYFNKFHSYENYNIKKIKKY